MRKVRIHRHQDIELIPLGAFQQRAVLDARPAEQGDGFDLCPGNSRRKRQSRFSSSSSFKSGRLQEVEPGFVEQGDDLFAFHAGEAFQKIVDGVASRQVVEQALNGHTRIHEDGCSAKDFGVAVIDTPLAHNSTIAETGPDGKPGRTPRRPHATDR